MPKRALVFLGFNNMFLGGTYRGNVEISMGCLDDSMMTQGSDTALFTGVWDL